MPQIAGIAALPRKVHGPIIVLGLAFLAQRAVAEEGKGEILNIEASMAATLLASLSFIMILFHFSSYKDEDIQGMTWNTINATISIFIAVLLFSSFNDLAEAYIIDPIFGEGDDSYGALLVDFIHMCIWFTVMQIVCAFCSGAAGPWAEDMEKFEQKTEDEQHDIKHERKVRLKCGATLTAHIAGFASINCFSTVQQAFFGSSFSMAILAPIAALLFMLILQRMTDRIRDCISKDDDQQIDEFENMWDEECEEAENDVMGLTLSFTTISAIRFLFDHCLPNQEGKEEKCSGHGIPEDYYYHHTRRQKLLMILLGCTFAAIIFIMRIKWPEWLEPEQIRKRRQEGEGTVARLELMSRFYEGIYVSISMCFSWSFFYGARMILAGIPSFEGNEELVVLLNALLLSILGLCSVLPLDWLADQTWTDEHCDAAIRSIISSIGLLIGFAWEQTFDVSVDAIADKTNDFPIPIVNPHTTKLALTLFCTVLLLPAWKWYILPFHIAQGWQQVYSLKFSYRLAHELSKPFHMEEIDLDERKMKEHDEREAKLQKLRELSKIAHHKALLCTDRLGQKRREGRICEHRLPQYNAEMLMQQADALKALLKREKEKSSKTQLMLDDAFRKLQLSVKQVHSTVVRIESEV